MKTLMAAESRSETSAEVADLGGGDVAGFDLEDDGFGIAGGVGEIESAVDALVSAFFLFEGAGVDEAEGPVLELVFVGGGEGASGFEVAGFADDGVGFGDVGAEGVGEADLDEVDGEVCDVDADPAAVEFLGGGDGGAAAAEGVHDNIARVRGRFDDAFEKGFGFLRGIAQALCRMCRYGRDVRDDGLDCQAGHLIKVTLVARHTSRFFRPDDAATAIKFIQSLLNGFPCDSE